MSQERSQIGASLFLCAGLGCAALLGHGGLAAAGWAAEPPQVSLNVAVNAPQQLFPNDNPASRTTRACAARRPGWPARPRPRPG